MVFFFIETGNCEQDILIQKINNQLMHSYLSIYVTDDQTLLKAYDPLNDWAPDPYAQRRQTVHKTKKEHI